MKIKTFAKTSKIARIRKFVFKKIKIKMTNIIKSIVVEHQCDLFFHIIKHIDNVKFQQLWKLCDFENYEIIFKIMREYLKTRKNEFMIKNLFSIEFSHSYKRFVIDIVTYNDLIKHKRKIEIKHNLIVIVSSNFKTKKKSIKKRVKKRWYWEIYVLKLLFFFKKKIRLFVVLFSTFLFN